MDPVDEFSFGAPAPAFAVESDSSDEEWDDSFNKLHRRNLNSPIEVNVTFDFTGDASTCVFAVGLAGSFWTTGLGNVEWSGAVCVDGREVAKVAVLRGTLLVLISSAQDLSLDTHYPIAERVIEKSRPSKVTIIDSYSVNTYFRGPQEDQLVEPPLRYLSANISLSSDLQKMLHRFDVPNLVSGISAAVVTEASHRHLPVLLLLLPSTSRSISSATLYDFGTVPAESPLVSSVTVSGLTSLGRKLEWSSFGWSKPNPTLARPSRSKRLNEANDSMYI